MGKRKQTKPTVVGISQKSTRTSSFSSTSYIASSVAAIAVLAVFFGSRNENSNIPERVTISMLRPSEPSEEDWIRSWQVNPETAQVDRVPFSEMTHEKLRENYLFPRRPVVLEGAYANSPLVNEWSFESIRAAYGDVHIPSFMIPAQKGHNTGCSFTGLCKNEDGMSLSKMFDETFLRPLEERKRLIRMGVPQPYPHDLDLQNMLPGMFQVYRKLSFFAENIRLVATRGTDKWPSLFFGAAGTHTGLHVDNYGTSFTMAVFRGRKQFGEL